jgi:hypothetical protein
MKVTFRQSGGVTGLIKGIDLDTATLSTKDANALAQTVAESGLKDIAPPSPGPARDLIQYEIHVESDDGKTVTARFNDMTVTEQVYPLLQFLMERAKPARPTAK